ncbi:MAG: LPP20 family lipoprotein [Proteobacteria bacterium]|nr:LPP20 family lipoprotein [Pseudomonadota bacterium]
MLKHLRILSLFSFLRASLPNIGALLIIASCAISGGSSINSLPSWYINPTQNNHSSLYGVGEGFTLAEAKNAALQNLASKLRVSISSSTSTILEEDKFSANEEFKQRINEEVEKISFSNYQVSNSANIGSRFYAEVEVDRANFIQEYREKLSGLNGQMSQIYRRSANKTILEKRNDLAKIVDLSIQGQLILDIFSGLGAIENSAKQKNLSQYNDYRQAYEEILDQIEFFVKTNNTPESISKVVTTALNKEKLKLATAKSSQNKNQVTMDILSAIVSDKIYGAYIAKVRLKISLISNQNKIIAGNEIEVSGSSVVSQNEAINAASRQLSEEIESQGLFAVIGIN